MQAKKPRRGQAGGKATVERHGVEHMRETGRKGGRPTWQETLRKAQEREKAAHERAKGRA